MKIAAQGHRFKPKFPRFGFTPTLTATMLAVFCLPAQAGFKLEIDAGLEYDSNVATDAAETDTGIGDFSRNLKLGLGYDHHLNKHWNLSGLYRLSDTRWQSYNDDVYAYQASTLKLQIKRNWSFSGYKMTGRILGRYEKRQYEGIRRSINAARADDRYRLALESSIQLAKNWQLSSSIQADFFNSNVAAVDYNQERIRFGLSWEF